MHGGASIDPDQGFVGIHYFARLADRLKIHPAADVGFGDDVTLIAIHIDFAQWFELGRSKRWSLYFGGGPAVNIYRFELGDDTEFDTEGGFDFVVGFAKRSGPMFEMRVGSSGSPDLRFAVGFTFGK